MRILTVVRGLGVGGMERAAEVFTLGYRDAGHEVAVLNLGSAGSREVALQREAVAVFRALDDAERFDPQVVHIHRRGQADEAESVVLRRLRTRRRRVLETNVFAWADYSAAGRLIDVHLQLSRWCLWVWRRRLGRDAPAVVVPYPLQAGRFRRAEPDVIAAFRQRWTPGATFVCGRVGQPFPGKWHAANIRAFVPLARRDPNAWLLLIGLPENLRPVIASLPADIKRRIRELPMTSSDAELSLFYSALDCFLHAANQGESFGYVLAEAMACGCPVVTVSLPTRDNSQVEVVGHLQGGLVAGSFETLSDALLQLWEEAALRRRIAERCRERILQICDANLVVARALRVAEIALAHENERALLEALAAEKDLVTSVTDEEIYALATNVHGEPRGLRWLKLANSYFVHRAQQLARRALRR
ncbi:MAG: glycosyltransferase family 4 protein [Verrucomicrobiae bacterium]|nr:glycosyltransferase family 4 protein [Verrucomicrobiae bacterium]